MYMYVYVYTYTYRYIYIYMYVHIYVYIHVCTGVTFPSHIIESIDSGGITGQEGYVQCWISHLHTSVPLAEHSVHELWHLFLESTELESNHMELYAG